MNLELYNTAKDRAFRSNLAYSSKEESFAEGAMWLREWLEAIVAMATAIKARYGPRLCMLCLNTGWRETGHYEYPEICHCGAYGAK